MHAANWRLSWVFRQSGTLSDLTTDSPRARSPRILFAKTGRSQQVKRDRVSEEGTAAGYLHQPSPPKGDAVLGGSEGPKWLDGGKGI